MTLYGHGPNFRDSSSFGGESGPCGVARGRPASPVAWDRGPGQLTSGPIAARVRASRALPVCGPEQPVSGRPRVPSSPPCLWWSGVAARGRRPPARDGRRNGHGRGPAPRPRPRRARCRRPVRHSEPMPSAPPQARRARRLLVLLAALTALVLAGCGSVGTTLAMHGLGAQDRVWALNIAGPTITGPVASGSACVRPGSALSEPGLASGFCVAAEDTAAAANAAVHGNSAASTATSYLYRLTDTGSGDLL
jgi:hypothetical protein